MLFDYIDCSVATMHSPITSAKHLADPTSFRRIVHFAAFQEPFSKYIMPDAVLI